MHTDSGTRIAIYAGPTGGHLFPAQAFAECCRKKTPDVYLELITSRRGQKLVRSMPDGIFDRVRYLPNFGLPHKIISWGSLKPLSLAPFLFLQAFFHLFFLRPQLCIGFGSFVAYPGMRVAKLLRIPTLIHEQNRVPGKATCWLAPQMDAVAVSFEGTRLSPETRNVTTLGLPLRSFIINSPNPSKKRGEKLNILVVGGSQGAHGLNQIVTTSIARLPREEREKIAVIHIAGEKDREWVAEWYVATAIESRVLPFHRNMFELFQQADLAVTRAGANTLFELAFYGIPAFVIPFPYAGGHQKLNAAAFADRDGLKYHDESPEAIDWLTSHLQSVLKKEKKLESMSSAIATLAKPGAAEELTALAFDLIEKK